MSKSLMVIMALTALAVTGFMVHSAMESHHKLPVAPTQVPTPVYDAWIHWKNSNNKKYGGTEQENFRLGVFHNNFQKIMLHQSNPAKTHTMGLNQFADLTSSEFKAMYLSTRVESAQQTNVQVLNTEALPATVDWRTKGAITPVKNQGQCGSCWAFSTTGALEGAFAVKGLGLKSFSEQQLVDCSTKYGNQGCNGGLMDSAFKFIRDNGITLEATYPYRGVDQKCKQPTGENKLTAWVDVSAGSADQLAAALVIQPVAIAVDAENWQFYKSGVFSDCSANLDHGVLLVAFDADSWTVKNSWASSWGENGFIRLKRGNTCGMANAASYPTL